MKERIKDVKFWISVGSAIILILSVLTDNFGIKEQVFVEVYSCVLAMLTTLGVLTKGGKRVSEEENIHDVQEEIKKQLENQKEQEK